MINLIKGKSKVNYLRIKFDDLANRAIILLYFLPFETMKNFFVIKNLKNSPKKNFLKKVI